MSRQYKAVLSPKGLIKEIDVNNPVSCPECGKTINKVKAVVRDIEKSVLISIFRLAADNAADLKKANIAWDMIGKLENLEDEESVIFDEADMELFDEGWKKSAGKRQSWDIARKLLGQFANKEKMNQLAEEKEA